MADRPRRLQDRTRAVASRSSGRHDGGRLCPLTGRVKPALPVPETRERSHAGAARADLVPRLVALNHRHTISSPKCAAQPADLSEHHSTQRVRYSRWPDHAARLSMDVTMRWWLVGCF